jgi:hypothetical protein
MRYLILIPFLVACQMSKSGTLQKVYEIKQDGILFEKRYTDKNNTTRIVTYDIETKQPNDSITLNYDEKGNLIAVKAYVFVEGKYEVDELLKVGDYYFQAYSKDSFCNSLLPIKYRFLIENIVSCICNIQQSVLPNGGMVSSLAKTIKNKEVIEISYSEINAKFISPYDIFQLYFYNQLLISFSLQIKDGHLIKETYSFSEGTFIREFFYDETGQLKKSVADVKYKNEVGEKITRTYELE